MKLPATLLPLAALSLLAAPLSAQTTVYSDDFDTANGASASEWFTFTTATLSESVDGSNGTWTFGRTSGSSGSVSAITYFTPQNLSVGNSITLSFNISAPTNSGTDGFRVGIFNSNNSKITADLTSVSDAAFNDDRGYVVFSNDLNSAGTNAIRERASGVNDGLFSNATGVYTTLGGTFSRTTRSAPSQVILTVTYDSPTQVSISYSFNGATATTRTDTTGLVTSFDSIALFGDSTTAGGGITLSDVSVTVIPEPSSRRARG